MILPRRFYTRSDVVLLAGDLLGKCLVSSQDGIITSGIITETEAYAGETDKASHAWNGRRTSRTEIMYRNGGTAYIYLCYGVHSLFNVVTNKAGIPHAVLIRGIKPVDGINTILKRLGAEGLPAWSISGPGKVTRALGIHYSQTGTDLTRKPAVKGPGGIWIEDRDFSLSGLRVEATPRIGVDYAGKDALLPYRFVLHQ